MEPPGQRAVTGRQAMPGAAVRSQRAVLVRCAVLLVGLVLAMGAGALVRELRPIFAALLALVVAPAAGVVAWSARRMLVGGGPVEASAEGLWVRGELAVPQAEILRAVVAEADGRVTVTIMRRTGFYTVVDVADEAEGQALVQALGFGSTQARSTFALDAPGTTTMSPWRLGLAFSVLVAVAVALMLRGMHGVGLGVLVAGDLGLMLGMIPASVTIGLDGLLVRWMWRRRLLRFRDVVAIEVVPTGVQVTLRSGERVLLGTRWSGSRLGSKSDDFDSPEAFRGALARRAREAWQASHNAGDEAKLRVEALVPAGQGAAAWARALRERLTRAEGSFREVAVGPEQLWASIEDGQAEPDARAAAAAALAPGLDEAGRERLRVVAGVVASPRLRVALEAAAEGDDERLFDALGALSDEGPRAPARRGG